MELAIAVASALAVICGIFITVFAYYHKHSLIIWATYLALMFVILVPFLYWQKRVWAESNVPPVNTLSPASQPSPSPSPELPTSTPSPEKPKPSRKKQPKIISLYDRERPEWTDYTEDEFYDLIWRWFYRPPDKTPRDIKPFCPECSFPNEMNYKLIFPTESQYYVAPENRAPYLRLSCRQHSQVYRAEHIPNMKRDDFSKIKDLISQRLADGSWEEVVRAKRGNA